MKLNVYSIFDTASGLYSRPFFTQSDGEAIRSFSDIANDAEHPVGRHPADFTLFRLGIFDDRDGKLTDEVSSSLTNALQCLANARSVDKDNLELFTEELQKANGPNETVMSSEEIMEAVADKLPPYGGTK